jgi:two-component system nitrate/nitrite sensor histidine kinase NarX
VSGPENIRIVGGAARTTPAAAGVAPSERLRALQILAEATSGAPGEFGIEAWLGRFLATLIRLTDAAAGAVRVVTDDGRHLRLAASAGLPPEVAEREKLMPLDCGACGAALRAAAVNPGASPHPCAAHASLEWFRGFAGLIVVPLVHHGQVLGVYNLFLREARRLPEDVTLLYRSIGEHIGMALENARLARENLRITMMHERQMLAGEVHDSLAQTMAYMKMRLTLLLEALGRDERERALKYAGDLQSGLGEAYADLRELLVQFRSPMDPLGLVHALERVAAEFEDRTGVRLRVENRLPELKLSVDEEANAFHILQEALANVARHSGARNALVRLEREASDYAFAVEDDGSGFFGGRAGAAAPGGLRHHLGVNIMQERAQRLSGRIEIANLPQGGARVRLLFPAEPAERAASA